MHVMVGTNAYEIDGVIMGRGPAWWLIKHKGEKMTAAQWEALPEREKDELAGLVQQHMARMNGQA